MRTALTELLGVRHPIVGFNRSPGVVAEVTKAGGFGVLAASMYTPEELDAQLTWIERQVDGRPYGVDLLVPEKFADGDPDNLVASLRAQIPQAHLDFVNGLLDKYGIPAAPAGMRSYDEVSAALTRRGAEALLDVAFAHPIALIANALGTPPAGLVARAKEAGIASGRQMAAALALGAAGVWCGSVWLSSAEDVANQAMKAKFLAASSSDTLLSPTRTGKPARQLRTAWHDEWERQDSPASLPMPLQPMLVNEAWQRIDAAASAGHEGALRLESYFIGQVVGSFDAVRPAGEITRRLAADCEQRIAELGGLL